MIKSVIAEASKSWGQRISRNPIARASGQTTQIADNVELASPGRPGPAAARVRVMKLSTSADRESVNPQINRTVPITSIHELRSMSLSCMVVDRPR
jgi:hypothetical protein